MCELVEQVKEIHGFKLSFPSGVNLNLDGALLNLKLVKN